MEKTRGKLHDVPLYFYRSSLFFFALVCIQENTWGKKYLVLCRPLRAPLSAPGSPVLSACDQSRTPAWTSPNSQDPFGDLPGALVNLGKPHLCTGGETEAKGLGLVSQQQGDFARTRNCPAPLQCLFCANTLSPTSRWCSLEESETRFHLFKQICC